MGLAHHLQIGDGANMLRQELANKRRIINENHAYHRIWCEVLRAESRTARLALSLRQLANEVQENFVLIGLREIFGSPKVKRPAAVLLASREVIITTGMTR